MNKLEKLNAEKNYFVSINPIEQIKEEKIIKTIKYHHPNFTVKNFSLQNELEKLNQDTRIFFAGAYFKYGFHEDGMNSGLSVVKKLKENK
jgi:predicted NAD/FAD-binding protein